MIGIYEHANAQTPVHADSLNVDSLPNKHIKTEDLSRQYDIADLIKTVFYPNRPPRQRVKKPSGIVVIPNIASNPSIGSQIGIKAVAGRKLGNDPNTLMSVAATSASITTKGIIYFYVNHNIYTPGNKWNLQGSIIAAKTVTPDFGLGIAQPSNGGKEDQVLANPGRKGRAVNGQFYNIREKVYKEVRKNLFVGVGVSFDIRRDLHSKDTSNLTPYNIYSDNHGFNRTHYMANGLFFNAQ